MKEILVIEDEADIQELLTAFLEDSGYKVTVAGDGVAGITSFHSRPFDLVLLDIMLPKIDGYGVCEVIRQESSVPIVMLTALDSEENQVKGYDLRVDDYITKPFSMQILIRKIEAVLRRTSPVQETNQLGYRNLVLDLDGYKVFVDGENIELTQREFELLRELLQNQGKVLTRQALLNGLWKYDFYGDERVVDTHIKNLRKKLDVDYIETIRGVGYRIDKTN
ncbi:response regulator transcription factor [Robinsoniella peoriensis]